MFGSYARTRTVRTLIAHTRLAPTKQWRNSLLMRCCSSPSTPSSGSSSGSVGAYVYKHTEVEKKWQDYWEEHQVFKAVRRPNHPKKKYVLDMFPYPSGAGLHVGHPEGAYACQQTYEFLGAVLRALQACIGW
jgi:hypothetical protein